MTLFGVFGDRRSGWSYAHEETRFTNDPAEPKKVKKGENVKNAIFRKNFASGGKN